jgi:hypothetical protein
LLRWIWLKPDSICQQVFLLPIIQGGGAPHDWPREIIAQVMADADALGHNGVIFQGTTSLVDYRFKV